MRSIIRTRFRRSTVLLWSVVCVLAGAVPDTRILAQGDATRPLPSRLSDAEFWKLVTDGSEAGGYFQSDNFTSNEMGFPAIVSRLRASGDTGGAYLGVGPEQNFSYIAGLRPRIAFLVDIRRQSVIQHLMYKAIFELSADRADFVSLLFSKPRPAGLDSASTIAEIWEAYWNVPTDTLAFPRNYARIVEHLTRTKGFGLDSSDLESLRYVYGAFYDLGPRIDYGGYRAQGGVVGTRAVSGSFTATVVRLDSVMSAARAAAAAAAAPPVNRAVLTGVVTDSATGAPIAGVTVRVVGSIAAVTNAAGVYRFPDLPQGMTVAVEAVRLGYAPRMISAIRVDQPVVTQDIALGASSVRVTVSVAPVRGVATPASATRVRTYYEGTNFAALTAALDERDEARSFLATEDSYRFVKDLQSRNLFIPLVGDFAGPKAIRSVGEYLRAHGTTLTAFYTSNVEQYLFQNNVWRQFYENAAALPVTERSVFIRSGTSTCPIGAFLTAAREGRVQVYGDATRCAL